MLQIFVKQWVSSGTAATPFLKVEVQTYISSPPFLTQGNLITPRGSSLQSLCQLSLDFLNFQPKHKDYKC